MTCGALTRHSNDQLHLATRRQLLSSSRLLANHGARSWRVAGAGRNVAELEVRLLQQRRNLAHVPAGKLRRNDR